jgi:hypothetical protein
MSDLILKDPHNWLLEQLYNANKTDHETFRIYKCLVRYIDDNRDFIGITEQITPTIMRFKPLTDVADDCLFSVTFFSDYIRKRSRRRGAPGVKFYTNAGKNAYSSTGYPIIAHNWEFWVDYVNNTVSINK